MQKRHYRALASIEAEVEYPEDEEAVGGAFDASLVSAPENGLPPRVDMGLRTGIPRGGSRRPRGPRKRGKV
jgi:hypothetical protein